ncbi:MAG TPA: DUF58 domain-containing protein [Acidobacteriota bacterium]|nr:DUF58 domain-containing protein [Acidobacteriota bacterium]HQM63814.1 DUF58 domain-containing protein [Acidobacteriota bacterium]
MLELKDLLRNLHLIQIRTRKKMQGGLASSYRNVFRGQGLEFSEVREYVEGDDIRLIDWNVSARHRNLYVKQLMEERELNIITALQGSRTMDYGTTTRTKFHAAAEIAALLIFSALHTGDRPGLIVYGGDAPMEFVPPQKGNQQGFLLLKRILAARLVGHRGDLDELLKFLTHGLKKKSVVFLVGDFIYSRWIPEQLEMACRRHDVIALGILDPTEVEGPPGGVFVLDGVASRARVVAVNRRTREQYAAGVRRRLEEVAAIFQKAGADFLLLKTDSAYETELQQLFHRRLQIQTRA